LIAASRCGTAAAIDETELDCDEELILSQVVASNSPCTVPTEATATADPFAEKFDEEEVVLDNFAGWDEMFRRDAPRVENRRDPGFATLVQAAIETSPDSTNRFVASSKAAVDATIRSVPTRPRLRLADVPDAPPVSEVLPPAASVTKSAAGTESLGNLLSAFASRRDDTTAIESETPVLVIEEDAPQGGPQPPVRREEYRHLFSRLRSG
jgi:hypothetical protein